MSWQSWIRELGPAFILGFIVKWTAVLAIAWLLHHYDIASGWWAVGIGTALGLSVLTTGILRALSKHRAAQAAQRQAKRPSPAPPSPSAPRPVIVTRPLSPDHAKL